MMTTINTNLSAIETSRALYQADRAISSAMERLSTGKRINHAGDDAAGLAISSRMTTKINGLHQAVRNANDAISLIQTADGALSEISDILQRMRELAVQASSGTYSSADFDSIKTEFESLRDEIQMIVSNTSWNGKVLLNYSAGGFLNEELTFQIGGEASQSLTVEMGRFIQNYSSGRDLGAIFSDDLTISQSAPVYRRFAFTGPTTALSVSDGTTTVTVSSATYSSIAEQVTAIQNATNYDNLLFTVSEDPSNNAYLLTYKNPGYVGIAPTVSNGATDLLTNPTANAQNAISHMDLAISSVAAKRSEFGASINRLDHVMNNLKENSTNLEKSRSRILDANYATETTNLTKNSIIKEAGTAVLAQANQTKKTVLQLLNK